MYSPHDTWCSHQVGSPIRISPDHRLCASPRSFSQLATSFIAYLRLGIPTHALSSLTIKLISNTVGRRSLPQLSVISCRLSVTTTNHRAQQLYVLALAHGILFAPWGYSCSFAHQYSVFKEHTARFSWQMSRFQSSSELTTDNRQLTTYRALRGVVGLGRFELPTSSLSGTRSNQLSYRPIRLLTGGAGRDRTGDLLSANQALSPAELQPLSQALALAVVASDLWLVASFPFRQTSHWPLATGHFFFLEAS
jgi:hypothetical protein